MAKTTSDIFIWSTICLRSVLPVKTRSLGRAHLRNTTVYVKTLNSKPSAKLTEWVVNIRTQRNIVIGNLVLHILTAPSLYLLLLDVYARLRSTRSFLNFKFEDPQAWVLVLSQQSIHLVVINNLQLMCRLLNRNILLCSNAP
jgi:hypothetical protein